MFFGFTRDEIVQIFVLEVQPMGLTDFPELVFVELEHLDLLGLRFELLLVDCLDLLEVVDFGLVLEQRALQAVFLNRNQLIVIPYKFWVKMGCLDVPWHVLRNFLDQLVFQLIQPGLHTLLLGSFLADLAVQLLYLL